jgi:hypothetical protein
LFDLLQLAAFFIGWEDKYTGIYVRLLRQLHWQAAAAKNKNFCSIIKFPPDEIIKINKIFGDLR